MPTLPDALQTLAAGGAASFVAIIFSWLAEQWPAFGKQPPTAKFIEQVIASALVGLGAFYLVTYQQALLAVLAPWFAVLAMAIGPVLAGQAWHAVVNRSKR